MHVVWQEAFFAIRNYTAHFKRVVSEITTLEVQKMIGDPKKVNEMAQNLKQMQMAVPLAASDVFRDEPQAKWINQSL